MKFLVILLAVFFYSNPSLAQSVAVVDLPAVIQGTQDGKLAKSQMQRLIDKADTELMQKEESLMKERHQLEKKLPILNEKAQQKEITEMQKKFFELEKRRQEVQQTLAEKEQKLLEPILSKIDKVVSEYAKKEKIDIVVDQSRGAVLFVSEKPDITEKIINIYNKKHKK